MAQNINMVVVTGNLTRDPELKHTQGGTAVVTLGVAVNGRKKKGDEWVDDVNFFDVTVFGNAAENCAQYLEKGRPVAIKGRLDWSSWTNDNGDKRSKVQIIADQVQFLHAGEGGGGGGGSRERQQEGPADTGSDFGSSDFGGPGDDDIPF